MTNHPRKNHNGGLKVAHIIAIILAIFSWLFNYFNIVNHDFPSHIAFVAIMVSYLCLIYFKSSYVAKNIFCLLIFIPIFMSSLNTGGIYSLDFIGLVSVPITAIILMNNKWGALWTVILLGAVLYSFRLEYLAPESYLNQLEKFDFSYFVGTTLFFFITTIGLVMLLRLQVYRKIKSLEVKDNALTDRSEKLEESIKFQNDKFTKANHDIKQPLRNINSFAQLLSKNLEKEPNLSKENLEYLNYILEGSKMLSTTVEELSQSR